MCLIKNCGKELGNFFLFSHPPFPSLSISLLSPELMFGLAFAIQLFFS